MRVKYLKGDKGKKYGLYSVVIPEDKEIEHLPIYIQESIKVLGELKIDHTEDLSNKDDEWSSTKKKQIEEVGASLSKICYGRCPSGIYYTFPPFSELNKIECD